MKWSKEHGRLLQLLRPCAASVWLQDTVEPALILLTLVSPVAGLRTHIASDPRLGTGNLLAPAPDASTPALPPVAGLTS